MKKKIIRLIWSGFLGLVLPFGFGRFSSANNSSCRSTCSVQSTPSPPKLPKNGEQQKIAFHGSVLKPNENFASIYTSKRRSKKELELQDRFTDQTSESTDQVWNAVGIVAIILLSSWFVVGIIKYKENKNKD